MLSATMDQCGSFKKVFSTIKDLISDANLNWTSEGISFQAMDSSHIALVAVFLDAGGFNEFTCPLTSTLGLSLKSMDSILSRMKNEEKLTLSMLKNSDELCFDCYDKKNRFATKFKMKLMDIDSESVQIEQKEHDVKIEMKSSSLRDLCKRFEKMVATDVNIKSLDNGCIQFVCDGENTSSETVVQPREETSIEIKEKIHVSFSLKYLLNFVKGCCFNEKVALFVSNQKPLCVKYIIDDECCKGTINYYLAPKVINEEDDD